MVAPLPSRKQKKLQRPSSTQAIWLRAIYLLCWWHHEWAIRTASDDTGMGHGYRNGPTVARGSQMPVSSVSWVSWCRIFSQAFPKLVVRWSRDNANISVLQNHSPLKCRSDSWQFVVEKSELIFFLGGRGRKMSRNIVFCWARGSSKCFHA